MENVEREYVTLGLHRRLMWLDDVISKICGILHYARKVKPEQ